MVVYLDSTSPSYWAVAITRYMCIFIIFRRNSSIKCPACVVKDFISFSLNNLRILWSLTKYYLVWLFDAWPLIKDQIINPDDFCDFLFCYIFHRRYFFMVYLEQGGLEAYLKAVNPSTRTNNGKYFHNITMLCCHTWQHQHCSTFFLVLSISWHHTSVS